MVVFASTHLSVDEAPVAAPPVVVYIDKQRLGRDCIGDRLAAHLPEWLLKPVATIRDLHIDDSWAGASLIVLRCHGVGLSAPEIAEEIKAIRQIAPEVPILFMSDIDDAAEVHMAMQLGARGYLPPSLSFPQALAAIRLVGSGGTYIPPCVHALPSRRQQQVPSVGPEVSNEKPIKFSARELEVLEQLRQGKQNKIIAFELNMCESTVKVHIRNIMKKLKVRNRTQVVLLTSNT